LHDDKNQNSCNSTKHNYKRHNNFVLWQDSDMHDTSGQLPVESVMEDLNEALSTSGTAVLQAPPGSGKTTRVPLALLDKSWLNGQTILMLEPRRLAATNAARYMASLRKEPVGDKVGYAIRYERKVSAKTRLEVITEGLLIRRLQSDPELKGVGLVIFDEFHERSMQADTALAFCREAQQGLREDLRILVMSATLDAEPLSQMLNDCPVITASGRSFPVRVEHLNDMERHRLAEGTSLGVRHALKETTGDILAFLPGAGEIRRCQEQLRDLSSKVDLRPLYGGLPFAEQEAAILPGKRRRVVLSTNIAETSLTIEGIESVVDSGWERRPRFDAARGMTRLETVRISRASAEQRTGRAGRLKPGRCFRLWSEGVHGTLLPFSPAEIRHADLASLALELAQWGTREAAELKWLDPPPAGHLTAARKLLTTLGALDENFTLTPLGKKMSRYPAHPRLARLLVAGVDLKCQGLASDLVAILSERDLLKRSRHTATTTAASDLIERLEVLNRDRSSTTATVRKAASYWKKLTKAGNDRTYDAEETGRLLASAYPDRIALRRKAGSDRFLLRNGQGATLAAESVVRESEWLVAAEIVGRNNGEEEIRLATALSQNTIEELFGDQLEWQREAGWDDQSNRVLVREVRRLGAILLQERPASATAEDTLPAICDLIRRHGLEILPWTRVTRQLQARAAFLHQHVAGEDWGDWSDQALSETLETWLMPFLAEVSNRNSLKRIDLTAALKARVGWQKMQKLDRLAPEKLEVPSGSKIRIEYKVGELPVLAVKLQELFGLAATPKLAEECIPVVIHLLSPAGRPLAVTQDLKSFWDSVYPEVKKEMKGRYPKHPWPEDPLAAQPTARTKRRSR
jgi:ATP-dependent helicase HrpB